MEALVTVKTLVAELKVKFVEVPTGDVPLPNKTSVDVKAGAPVPPLATGKIPLTEEPNETAELYKAPDAVLNTGRFWFRLAIVVEPLTFKVPVTDEVAK